MANKNIDGRNQFNIANGRFWSAKSVAIAAAATITYVFKCFMTDNISIQLNWTSTLKGVFTLQTCLDYCEDETGSSATYPGTWTDITANASTKYPYVGEFGTAPSGSNTGPFLFNVWNLAEPFLQLTYTADGTTPGSGTITGFQNGKGL